MEKLGWMTLLAIWGLVLGPAPGKAQNYNEFFRQQKTQEKYLLKQLAYLKLYADQAWKGYQLVSGGLETINELTSGEFRLHEAFISALSKVSALVRKEARFGEIVQFQLSINANFRALQQSSALDQSPHSAYYRAVREKVMDECKADLEELLAIVLSENLEMDDAARLSRLKQLHDVMQEKASFTRWFCSEAQRLMQNEKQTRKELEELRRMYEKH